MEGLRADLARLVGLGPDDVLLADGAGTAFATLLAAWPLGRGARVGTVPSEYGANARVLARLAAERGWSLVVLPVDGDGRVTAVPDGLDLVTFPQVASQRGVAQPVADVLASGTPLLLDVAQSLGQTEVPAGCAAYVGTSRKWLCGPRGVGLRGRRPRRAGSPRRAADPGAGARHARPPLGRRRSRTSPAGSGSRSPCRSGTGAAARRAGRGAARARRCSTAARGWRVREPVDEPTGITTLEPGATRSRPAPRLLERGLRRVRGAGAAAPTT